MRGSKPIHVILAGSVIVLILLLVSLSVLKGTGINISFVHILVLSFGITTACFLVFYLFVERFISSKIKILYRSIRKTKITDDNSSISMYKDVLAKAADDTKKWADERNSEISKLKEQEAFRREFLGNLAHELKTPVFSIQGYILTLLEGGLEDETVNRSFLEKASKATDRMTSILEDLDEIAKMEVDRVELNITKFDLVDLAKEVMDSFEFQVNDKNIQLQFNRDYDSIEVLADRGKIGQVLTNLISNSIAYGNYGGKTQVKFYYMDEAVMCEVADNGPGIEEHLLPRLFERFYRVEQSRNRNEGGSGLGLAIVKHILESHNQTINVRSTIDVGCTFYFTLKLA